MKNRILVLTSFIILVAHLFFIGGCKPGGNDDNRGKYDVPQPQYRAESSKAIVVGTTGAPAIRAGLQVLKEGGSAADAAMTIALGQISLAAGCWVSYAGAMSMVYYEAETGKIYTLNARFKTPQEEDDPLSIPPIGTPSGRSALVPGFMAGVQVAHDRFGVLPFERLFEPAIYFAEKGFEITEDFFNAMQFRKDLLMRLPETRRIFRKKSGIQYQKGDIFFQTELAETLKQVASQGAGYMYTGEWARKFVEIVQREGGKIVLKDMEDYRVIWPEPLHSTYNGHDIYTLPSPNYGGSRIIEMLNLLECAGLKNYKHFTESAQALYRIIKIDRIPRFLSVLPGFADILNTFLPGVDISPESRLKKETARLIWDTVESGEWNKLEQQLLNQVNSYALDISHSDAIIVVDERGNVAAVEHTINTDTWGTTGIFVDGVSIPDAACFQQQAIFSTGPGKHLPDSSCPALVLFNDLPVLASSAVGHGLTKTTFMNLYHFLDFDMIPEISVKNERIHNIDPDNLASQLIVAGDYPEYVVNGVRNMGQELTLAPIGKLSPYFGYWTGVKIDHEKKRLYGAASLFLDLIFSNSTCHAEGY
jgi:gamma-glutamyltranspeptidase/glutathione hydrolase